MLFILFIIRGIVVLLAYMCGVIIINNHFESIEFLDQIRESIHKTPGSLVEPVNQSTISLIDRISISIKSLFISSHVLSFNRIDTVFFFFFLKN